MRERISPTEIKKYLLQGVPLIDVRAPAEFEQGSLPNSINLPLLNNEERALVGTCYKQQGKEKAIELGHQLISGDVKKSRLDSWKHFLSANPNALIFCFRGGLRSQTVQSWLKDEGLQFPILEGGYKAVRNYLIESLNTLSSELPLIVISGKTGSHKTVFLEKISDFYPTVDLEKLALHRGSAFGNLTIPQPTQIHFENELSLELLKLSETPEKCFTNINSIKTAHDKDSIKPIAIEDESRMIGKIVQPESLFNNLRNSNLVFLEEPLDVRIENILIDYIQEPLEKSFDQLKALNQAQLITDEQSPVKHIQFVFKEFKNATQNISKKLGGLQTSQVLKSIELSEKSYLDQQNLEPNREWIQILLKHYYDPLYEKSFNRRQPRIVHRGNFNSTLDYFKGL